MRAPGDASQPEVLLYALLLNAKGVEAAKVEAWAAEVRHEASRLKEMGDNWVPANPADWATARNAFGRLVKPMAVARGAAGTAVHQQAATALRVLRLPGHRDEVCSKSIANYLYDIPREPASAAAAKKGRQGSVRCFGRALVAVAQLIGRDGSELRRAMRGELDHRPSAAEELAHTRTALKEEKEARKKAAADLQLVKDAHRKLKERAKEQRTEARKKAKTEKKTALEKERKAFKARVKDARARLIQKAREKATAEAAAEKKVLAQRLAKARARARLVEGNAKRVPGLLKRAQGAEKAVKELQATLEEEEETEDEESEDEDDESMPTAVKGRRDSRGRYLALPYKVRVLIWAELSRRVAPSAVASNISDVIGALAPQQEMPLPCETEIGRMRGELTIASEAIAAFRVALSKRIISFGWDESTKFGLGLLSSNAQIEPHDAPGTSVDVVMRGATLTAGGTAEAIAWAIDKKVFAHARRLLQGWRDEHEKRYGVGSWLAAGGPAPGSIGINRLTEQTVLMSDTCNAARACKRLIKEAAMAALRAEVGEAVWDAMSESERAERGKVYIGECQQHLRNIVINAMSNAATEHLKDELRDSLSEFSAYDRMSVDCNDLIRAIFKELHAGGEYAKGKQREYEAWRKRHTKFESSVHMPFECANGNRQDIVLNGSVPIFVNRKVILEFLRGLMVPGADNKLEKFLWRVLSCNEMTAVLRVNTLWKYIFSEPARYLAGKGSTLRDWSLDSSSEVLDLIEKVMAEVAADGRKLFDPSFDPFASIAEKQPLFQKWREEMMAYKVKAPDGSEHPIHAEALAEARTPADADGGNEQATERVVELAEKMAAAALVAMRDPRRAICSLLTSQDGEFAVGKDPSKQQATIGAHVTNCRVESNFGSIDILMRMFRYATVENVSGIAQQMRNGDFNTPPKIDNTRGRKRKEGHEQQPARGGFFHTGLTPELRESLVDYARHSVAEARKAGRAALKAHDDEKILRRELRTQTQLDAAIEHYARALELFDAWSKPDGLRATSKQDVQRALHEDAGLKQPKPEAQRLEYLRLQIEMRTLGCGWTKYSTRWSSKADQRIGTVAHLTQVLEEIIEEEKARARFTAGTERGLPTEAAPPHCEARDIGQLATADKDAVIISKRALFSREELLAKAKEERQRRIEAGIADGVEMAQPKEAPAFDQDLVGKQLEVLWRYREVGTEKPHLIWSTGRVVRVADGKTDKRSKAAKKILPAGMVLWAWDADPAFDEKAGEQWLALLPKKFNPTTHKQVYSWRFDPRELGVAQAPVGDERRKRMRREVES